ncbi:MAG: DUF4260 domain-containing protein [Longimicrobiales bacterium]
MDPDTPSIRRLLHLEGAAVLLASAYGFYLLGGSWFWFAVFFLLPDLFMLGYLAGERTGAISYNVAHTYVTPGLLVVLWLFVPEVEVLRIALVWTAHIGFDRVLGYGLKYRTGFKDTHLHRV